MGKILTSITIFIFLFISIGINAFSFLGIEESASYILIESKTGNVIVQNRADDIIRPASTTKIMTAIVALEHGNLNDTMDISLSAVLDIGPSGMNIGLQAGETGLTLEHMLNVLLIRSANETANIISENVGKSREDFLKKMNQKALELGAKNTYFVNPSGKDNLDIENKQLTTASDMIKIARFGMSIPTFREIVKKSRYNSLPQTNIHDNWNPIFTTNRLILNNNEYSYEIDGKEKEYTINGIKTGYTKKAQGNLIVSGINKDGIELIAAIMNVRMVRDTFIYGRKLLEYGFSNYSKETLVNKGDTVKNINIQTQDGSKNLTLIASNELKTPLPKNTSTSSLDIEKKTNVPENKDIIEGDVLGQIEYKKDELALGTVHLLAGNDIIYTQSRSTDTPNMNKQRIAVIVILLIAFLSIIFKKLKKKTK